MRRYSFWEHSNLVTLLAILSSKNDDDGRVEACAIVLDPDVIRTRALPRRPFQGWRYLAAGDAPEDLGEGRAQEDVLPPKLAAALADIGVR